MTSKNTKICSFRLKDSLLSEFKEFCARNNVTIKDSLTKVINLLLEAEVIENDKGEDLLDVQET